MGNDFSQQRVLFLFACDEATAVELEFVATVDLFKAWSWCDVGQDDVLAPDLAEGLRAAFVAGVVASVTEKQVLDAEWSEQVRSCRDSAAPSECALRLHRSESARRHS